MMSSKLVQIFAGAMVVLIFLMFATQPEHKPLKSSVLGFKVLESDALFFKNLRQFYYDKEFHEDAGYELFRHPDQKPLDSHEPRLVILNNWLMDEAYIMFENKDGSSIHAKLRVKNEVDEIVYDLQGANAVQQQEIAAGMYYSLADAQSSFLIYKDDTWVPIWDSESKRKIIKGILKDYFKLVGSL